MDKFKHISLDVKKEDFVKMRRRAIGGQNPTPVDLDKFKKMLNEIDKIKTLKVGDQNYLYFVLALTIDHHNSQVQKMLSALKLDTLSVLESSRLLVKGDKDFLATWKEKDKVPLYVRRYIKEIRALDIKEKIGESLRKALNELRDEDKVDIIINPIDGEPQEKEKIKQEIEKHIGKEYHYSNFLGTFSCKSSSDTIKKLSDLPFIKNLSLKPQGSLSTISLTNSNPSKKAFSIAKTEKSLGTICLLDTGVNSDLFGDLVMDDPHTFQDSSDYQDHGTGVASVALFGSDLFNGRSILRPRCNILNFKISDKNPSAVNIEDSLAEAIKKYKKTIPVYNLSYNYIDADAQHRLLIAEKLDRLIQEANVLVVNSCGNIIDSEAEPYIADYPKYLLKFPCYSPAEAKSIFSVGSICRSSTSEEIKISSFTRLGVTPLLMSSLDQRSNYIKPDINTYGGNNIIDISSNRITNSSDLEFPVFTNTGEIVYKVGTSLAAPLISQSFLKLKNLYPHYYNSETFKAMLLNQAKIHSCENQPLFSLLHLDNIGYCEEDSIFLAYEGITKPHQRREDDKKTEKCEGFSVEFNMPEEAESMDIVAVHSNNYRLKRLDEQNTRLVIKVSKESGTAMSKDFGNLGKFSSVLYGTYHFKRNYRGKWKIQLYLETQGVPATELQNLLVRWGISLRINLKNGEKRDLQDIYQEVSGNKQSNYVKNKVMEVIVEPQSKEREKEIIIDIHRRRPIAMPS
jgi:vacuolar-type H+-ATPase subunit F/Vma7